MAKRSSKPKTLVPLYATRAKKTVHLTFDDGPHAKHTKTILDLLLREHIKDCGQSHVELDKLGHQIPGAGQILIDLLYQLLLLGWL